MQIHTQRVTWIRPCVSDTGWGRQQLGLRGEAEPFWIFQKISECRFSSGCCVMCVGTGPRGRFGGMKLYTRFEEL